MPRDKSTDRKCREIISQIITMCNNDTDGGRIVVGFEPDWGGNSLTVHCAGIGHSHVGLPESTFGQLVDSLHGLLVQGSGLSFSLPTKKPTEPKDEGPELPTIDPEFYM